MKPITSQSTVVMHFTLTAKGHLIKNTRDDRPVKFTMGDGSFSEAFESALLGLNIHDKKSITLQPEDAFGRIQTENIYHIPRERFPTDMVLEKDLAVSFDDPSGREMIGIVKMFDEGLVTVDFNHPLAGCEVTFDVEIMES